MITLPESISPAPEREALELGLEHVIFDPVEEDEKSRNEKQDEETPALRAYLLLDASQSSEIPICMEAYSDSARCLFDGLANDDLADVGPWLAEVERYSSLWDWFVEEGYGQNWGIVLHSRLSQPRLKTQLKKFLKIEDDDGVVYYFKYYRPEHLNNYLPGFEEEQLTNFMRGIDRIYAEHPINSNQLNSICQSPSGKFDGKIIDLMAAGNPHRILPANPKDAEIWIKSAEENA